MDKEAIKNIRFSLDMTQAQFAKALGVTIHSVQSWEQGINTPSERSEYKIKELSLYMKIINRGVKS